MNAMKKILSVLFAAALALGTLAGCKQAGPGGSQPPEGTDPPPAGTGQPEEDVTLKVAFYNYGAQPADLQKVQDALNEMLRERIGCGVELMPISAADYTSRINLMLQNGDELDLLLTGTGLNYYIQASAGQLLPLNSLLDSHGKGVTGVLGEYLEATRMPDGELYAVPVYQSYSAGTTFVMRKDILDKYGLKAADVKTLDDLEDIFAVVHKTSPAWRACCRRMRGPAYSAWAATCCTTPWATAWASCRPPTAPTTTKKRSRPIGRPWSPRPWASPTTAPAWLTRWLPSTTWWRSI